MAYDYAGDVAFAAEMVAEFGRNISFLKRGTTTNASNPLGAPTTAAPAPVTGVKAVFVYPTGLDNLGLSLTSRALFKQAEQIAIVAADGVNAFEEFQLIEDGSTQWAITAVEVFTPGDTAILYYVGVKRP